MANSYSASVTASQVGSYFVQQYYQVLQQQPDFVHQFYNDSSTMVRVDGESTENASAVFQIHTLIQSFHFTAIEIKTINALESWSQGIVVVVTGSVRSKYFTGWRKFVQTFFLAPQEKGYFVLNDIFQFVTEEVTNHLPPPLASGHKDDLQQLNSTSQELSGGQEALEVETRENFNSLHLEGENQGDYYASEEHQHHNQQSQQQQQQQQQEDDDYSEYYEEEPPVEESYGNVQNNHNHNHVEYIQEPLHQNTQEYVQEPLHQNTQEYVQEPLQHEAVKYVQEPYHAVEEPAPVPVKFTYASVLQSKAAKSVLPAPAQVPVVKTTAPTSEWNQPPEPVASYVPETTPVTEDSFANEEEESKSVYVRNLPTSVTSQEIFQEFKNFGKIKQDGVFLKNRKDVGICFAFVEFEDAGGVQKAIESSPIHFAGRQVYIEERRANGSSNGTRGGRGGRGAARGRGSYDASRGRYGGVSSARGNGFRNV